LSSKEDNEESQEPNYDEDKEQLGEVQEKETEERANTKTTF
jgi:hypothetical protein